MNVWERIIIAVGALFTIMVISVFVFVEDIPVVVKSEAELAREKVEAAKAVELEKLIGISEALLPQVAEDLGTEMNGPINLKVINSTMARQISINFLENTFINGELESITECLAFIGLLPEEFDLKNSIVDLKLSERAVFYDPSTSVTYAVIDAPADLLVKEEKDRALLGSITHALQDRKLNISNNIIICKGNLDNLFAFEAMISGQVQLVMATAPQGVKPEAYQGDLGENILTQFAASENASFNNLPVYIQERQKAARAAGSSFVQAYLNADPENKLSGLWELMPVSSEQILHFDKYTENDMPQIIDISGVKDVLPAGYELFFSSTLGEFDVRVLTSQYEQTQENSVAIGEGWDGIHFAVFKNEGKTIFVAASIWDTNNDALEFSNAMKIILREKFGRGNYATKKSRTKLSFIAGDIKDLDAIQVLLNLEASPADVAEVEAVENE